MPKVILHGVPGYEGDLLFKPCINDWNLSYVQLKKDLEDKGYEVYSFPALNLKEVDRTQDISIHFDVPKLQTVICKKSLLVMLEPPVVYPRQYERIHGLPYSRILTYALDFVDNDKIFFSHFPIVRYREPVAGDHSQPFVAITSNKMCPLPDGHPMRPSELYTARRMAYLSLGKDLDLYGKGWGTDTEILQTVTYRGEVEDKIAIMSRYETAIVFENMLLRGWCSEKYWDAVQAGCRLVYRGWRPDGMTLDDVDELAWSKRVIGHMEAIL